MEHPTDQVPHHTAEHTPTSAPTPSDTLADVRHPRLLGALAGLVAGGVALGTAEAVSALSRSFQSPVLDVGDRVVDSVPNAVKELAIDWFGTNDKTALLIGIGSILAVYAAVVGAVAFGRRLWPALAGIAAFGVVGAYASQTTRRAASFGAVTPSIVGAVAGVAALWGLRRLATRRGLVGATHTEAGADHIVVTDPIGAARRPSIAELVPNDRRRFLAGAAGLAAAGGLLAAGGRRARHRFDVAAERRALTVPAADRTLMPAPAGVSAPVDGTSPFFTPNRGFYRIDTALSVPQVDVDSWRLRISGMVDSPVELDYEQLLQRELIESDITLTCVSNEVGGKLLGTARWLGIRLDDLLADAGVSADADQIVGRSVDGYTCGFPVAALDGRDALVAIAMNGELLPLEHGFPARLIVPGLYGYVSATKWLSEIELTRFDRFDQYWVERGWVEDAPIKVQSRIDTPKGLASVDAGTVAIAGVAWAQRRGIDRVELQIDDGAWVEATLADELNVDTWRQWSYAWEATPGRHTVRVRATERVPAGTNSEISPIQTAERSEPFPSGATGQHQIVVIVR